MRNVSQSTATNIMVFVVLAADHVTGASGKTLAVSLSKNGGDFAVIEPTVTDRGYGWYSMALTAVHTAVAGDLVLHVTASSCDPTDMLLCVVPDLLGVCAQSLTGVVPDLLGLCVHVLTGAATLDLSTGIETLHVEGRADLTRTLFKDATKLQHVSSASDPVLGTTGLV